ncbi:MAG TPA: amidohydrolase family protein, partial [Chitinophagales bacterium]|nr:amidohydrolase family protein [Chitinophagales bacterium]
MKDGLKANNAFFTSISKYYQDKGKVPTSLKVNRKEAFLQMSNLSAAFQRMAQEPKSKQNHFDDIYELVEINHSFLASLASLSSYIQNHKTTAASEEFIMISEKIQANLDRICSQLKAIDFESKIINANPLNVINESERLKFSIEHLTNKTIINTENVRNHQEALKMGADVVGGIPHYEPAREFGEKSIHDIVKLALKYDKLIDVHCDETDDPNSRFVEILNALVLMEDFGTKTTASHTCSFGSADNSYAYRMLDLFKKSKMNFISLPTENAYLQGRQDTYPKRRGLTRVKEFMELGINVAFGQDSINDPWYPMGNGNMMNILDNGIHLAQIMSKKEIETNFDLITYNGARCLNIQNSYGLEVGKAANFIVLNESSVYEAIRRRVDVLASVRNGNFLFRKKEIPYDIPLS